MLHTATAQTPIIKWQKALGGTDTDVPQCIYQTKDGGFIVGGVAASKDGDVVGQHGKGDFWVVKLSASGIIEWRRAFGGGNEDQGTLVQQTLDGGYIIGGNASSSNGDVKGNHGGGDIWVLKLSESGSIVWQRCLGGNGLDELKALQEVTVFDPVSNVLVSRGFIVGGNTLSNNGDVSGHHGNRDVWIVKLALKGDKQWQRALGSSGEETLNHLEATLDGGFIMGSRVSINGGDVSGVHGSVDLWVVKLDKDGQIEWKRTLGGSGLENFTAIRPTKDGGYIVGTHCNSNDGDVSGTSTTTGIWIVKLNATGVVSWQKKFDENGYSEYRDVRETNDGSFVVCGLGSDNDIATSGGVLVAKINANGTVAWQREYGGSKNDEPYLMQQTSDGGTVIAGATSSPEINGFHVGRVDYWLLKLNESGIKQWEQAYGGSDEDWPWAGCCGGTTLSSVGPGMMLHSSLMPYKKLQGSDGGYFFAISTKSRDGDVSGLHYNSRLGIRSDMWVVSLSPEGHPVVQSTALSRDDVVQMLSSSKAFPNPFHAKTTIRFTATENGKTSVDLYDINSVKLQTLFNKTVAVGEVYAIEVQEAVLPKGVYFYIINNGKNRQRGRLIKN